MNKENLKEIKQLANENQINIDDKLIAFTTLYYQYKDELFAFKTVFNENNIVSATRLSKNAGVTFMLNYLTNHDKKNNNSDARKKIEIIKEDNNCSLTGEENKSELINILDDVKLLMGEGSITKKDGYKMMIDVRKLLKEKFDVTEEKTDKFIVVNKKYNSICPHCHKEILIQKEEK